MTERVVKTEPTITAIAPILERLEMYGAARNRNTDPVLRRVSLTDNEALIVFNALVELLERRNNDIPEESDERSD